jgi:hypothetical protein
MSKPPVFIRTLEDSPPWLDQQLVLAYLHTLYQVQLPEKVFVQWTIGRVCATFWDFLIQHNLQTAAIITASNPKSKLLEEAANQARQQQLAEQLAGIPLVLPAKNISADALWPVEHGFCVVGIDQNSAIALAMAFEQLAVVWYDKTGATLLFPGK